MVNRKSGEINVISAEGRETYFDLREFINRWRAGFRILGLNQMEEALERKMALSKRSLAKMEKWTRQGYNFAILFPPNPWQYSEDIVMATMKPMCGLAATQQYNDKRGGIQFHDEAQNNFPQGISTLRRPKNKPYILLVKPQKEVDLETLCKSPRNLSERFADEGKTGVTVYEYCLIQRMLTAIFKEQQQPHPNSENDTFLLDSDVAGLWAVSASWFKKLNYVGIGVAPFAYPQRDHGAMSAIVIPLS